MLALAATDAVGAILFATLYAVAGARYLDQRAFLACLVLLFGLVTALWLWVEARHRAAGPLRRVWRASAGLALVIVGTPALTLMPLFWLDGVVPPEAGLDAVKRPVMVLLLISLGLVAAVNVIGGVIAVGRGLLRSRSASPSSR